MNWRFFRSSRATQSLHTHSWVVTLAAFAVAAVGFAPLALAQAGQHPAKKIVVIAHRGAHREAPENTLASLEKAIEIGCDYVELDVRRTKDGALVIMHDNSVNRMTNGKGKIADLTLAEIRKFEVKSRHGAKWAGL